MELVIWGVGKRGKIAADFVGRHNVKAFVDSNPVLVGERCYGIPIITLDQYIDVYLVYPLLISPLYNQEIIKELREKILIRILYKLYYYSGRKCIKLLKK